MSATLPINSYGTQTKNELLVSGHIRESVYPMNVPHEINNLILSFLPSIHSTLKDIGCSDEFLVASAADNLKSKLQFVLTMLFDKDKLTNTLEPIHMTRDKDGGIKKEQRVSVSVGERLICVSDFTSRIASLAVLLSKLECDEVFWAVAGFNSSTVSQKVVGRYFSSLIDFLTPPIECEVSHVLSRVIELARLRYRSQDVQKSFHYTCHILNKLQYPIIGRKIDHRSCYVTAVPHLRSFPEMLNESISVRSIAYSEHFVSQMMECICQKVLFCHQHDTVNFNLNCNSLGFDAQLRPILLDFSRSIVCGEEDVVSRLYSVMSSTPPELALLMGSNNPLMNIDLNVGVMRKADAWRCGVLLYVLLTGQLPYHATSLGNYLTQTLTLPPKVPVEEITWISDDAKDLLYKLLETTYFNRADIKEALKHKWFKTQSRTSLPTSVIDNIINLCKLENARSWIATMAHSGYAADEKQLDRDRMHYGERILHTDELCIFIMERLGYCKYKAKQIVNEYHPEMEANESAIEWKHFVTTYVDIQWNEDDTLSKTKQFTNAIFRGLDPNGEGCVDSKLLLESLQDINLKSQTIVNKLTTLKRFTFEQTVSSIADAFKNGFDITDLLFVDNLVFVE
eukprot:976553_1